eukprot:9044746-Pyramimonas_sp.AAC.1
MSAQRQRSLPSTQPRQKTSTRTLSPCGGMGAMSTEIERWALVARPIGAPILPRGGQTRAEAVENDV